MSDIIRLALYESQSNPKKYKGFHIKNDSSTVDESGMTHLIFTNGEKDIAVTGYNEDSARVKAFNLIDRYYQE